MKASDKKSTLSGKYEFVLFAVLLSFCPHPAMAVEAEDEETPVAVLTHRVTDDVAGESVKLLQGSAPTAVFVPAKNLTHSDESAIRTWLQGL